MAFVGVAHIGFTPYEFYIQWPGVQNASKLDNAIDMFNVELKSSVDTLAKDLPEAKLTFLNSAGIASGGPAVIKLQYNAPAGRKCHVLSTYLKF